MKFRLLIEKSKPPPWDKVVAYYQDYDYDI